MINKLHIAPNADKVYRAAHVMAPNSAPNSAPKTERIGKAMLATPLNLTDRKVTSKEAIRNWKEVTDEALKGPVVITAHGRPRHVLLGYEDYVNLRRQVRQAFNSSELTPELVDGILTDLRSAIGRKKDGDVIID